jgi:hypothetical protein
MTAPKKPIDVLALFPEVSQIADAQLREAVVAIWNEFWQQSDWPDIQSVPTSAEISYSHIPHNRAVVAMALAVADAFERFHGVKVNRDTLIAAALLQDVSKLAEYRPGPDGKVEKTEAGAKFPHAFLAAHAALDKGVPADVVHILLFHSPGAAKFPESLEGKILYYVDQLDVLAIHKDRFKKQIAIIR